MLINDLAGTGLLVGNSSQSPESGVRTHAVPSKTFRRVTEYAGTPSYSSSSTACPGMADRAKEIATIPTILIHLIASSPFPKTSSHRCSKRHLPAWRIGKKLHRVLSQDSSRLSGLAIARVCFVNLAVPSPLQPGFS